MLISETKNFRFYAVFASPFLWLLLVLLLLALLLSLPLVVPIGPMYWDTYLYLDAAHRISMGQIPGVDFSAPVGPLGYYLFTGGLALFPNAQPLLLAQWSLLVVTAPLLAMVLTEVSARSRPIAFALLAPFLVFAVSPANAQFYHSIPGLDGFGIYNRQCVTLLYVLVSGLVFMRDGRKLALFCVAAMLALFLTKITGFLVGGLFGVVAVLGGRIAFRNLLVAFVLFVVSLILINLGTGMISAYLSDIVQLAQLNQESLLPRFRTVISNKFDVILPAVALTAVLLLVDFRQRGATVRFFDRDFFWFSVALAGGIIFETQNTGSQEFIFLWPLLLMIFGRINTLDNHKRLAVATLAAFCLIPTFTSITHKTLRALAVAPIYEQANAPLLKNIRQVSTRHDIMQRALMLEAHYSRHRPAYQDLADQNQLPSWQFYSDLDNQMYWVVSANEVVKALGKFEAQSGLRLRSLMTLDFTDPFPWILDREATRHIQIGSDPTRTVSEMKPETRAAVKATEGVLRAKCPVTWARNMLETVYGDALKDRKVIALNPCWDLLLRPDLLNTK